MIVLDYKDTSALMAPHVHGRHVKDLVVLHETVSKDIPGWQDIDSVDAYLAAKDYGIHGINDAEGNIGYARNLGRAIFWQAGGVNERSIGIEQVSNVMLRSPDNLVRKAIWFARQEQLRATAKTIAAITRAHSIPLVYSDSTVPGVTSHWDVSRFHPESEGHSDCWPVHKGGYYPIGYVILLARAYAARGYVLAP